MHLIVIKGSLWRHILRVPFSVVLEADVVAYFFICFLMHVSWVELSPYSLKSMPFRFQSLPLFYFILPVEHTHLIHESFCFLFLMSMTWISSLILFSCYSPPVSYWYTSFCKKISAFYYLFIYFVHLVFPYLWNLSLHGTNYVLWKRDVSVVIVALPLF